MHFVHEPRLEILPNRRNTAAEANVTARRRLSRSLQRFVNSSGHEVERRALLHRQSGARMMGQDEHRRVIRRGRFPTSPSTIRPATVP